MCLINIAMTIENENECYDLDQNEDESDSIGSYEDDNSNEENETDEFLNENDSLDTTYNDTQSVLVDMARTKTCQSECVMCGKSRRTQHNSKVKLHRISDQQATIFYIKTNILIPSGSRACKKHFTPSGCLKVEDFTCHEQIEYQTRIGSKHLKILLETLRNKCNDNNLFSKFSNVDESLDDITCTRITSNIRLM